jgi:hypothetical protein
LFSHLAAIIGLKAGMRIRPQLAASAICSLASPLDTLFIASKGGVFSMKTTVTVRKSIYLTDRDSGDIVCSIELETAQDALLTAPDAYHRQVRAVIESCRKVVNGEAVRDEPPQEIAPVAVTGSVIPERPRNGGEQKNGARASDKQLVYLRQLARLVPAVGLRRLEEVAQNVCGKATVVLSTSEASRLIDSLKAVKAGEVDINQILPGAPA